MNDAEKIARAERCQKLLTNEDLSEAFENVERAIFAKIKTSPINDADGLGKLRLCLKLLSDVRANLLQAVNDGKMAEFKIAEEEQAKKSRFAFFR